MKKILMFAFAVFFVVGMFYFFNMGHSFTYWKGAIKAPGQEQEMILVLEKNLFGDVQGKMTFPGQMLNLKTNRCYFSGDSLKIEVSDMMQAKFSGARVGTGITGNWIQNGRSFPVILMETNSVPLQQIQVNTIVNYAKENALNRSSVNWDSLERLHYFMVHHDKPDSGLIIGANRLLKVLQDNHGFLFYKGDAVRNPVAYKGKPVKGIKAYTNFFMQRVWLLKS